MLNPAANGLLESNIVNPIALKVQYPCGFLLGKITEAPPQNCIYSRKVRNEKIRFQSRKVLSMVSEQIWISQAVVDRQPTAQCRQKSLVR